ncbi:MAG: hypothetical protein H6719_24415 [Sandaracinaceae bacterium]|nr:hypothetical protein [Sandaracinaceae bacterium]
MKKALLYLLVGAVMLVGLSSCRSRVRVRSPSTVVMTGPQPQPPPPTSGGAGVRVSVGGVGITALAQSCNPNAAEACNGLDDNCNGVIDEGCGFSGGNIQVTLAWTTGADLDLYVTDPTGYTISYSRRQSPSGGVLDQDARGACVPSQGATIENVYWDSPNPPRGSYRVEVHNYSGCQVSNLTQGTLSIAVGGQVIGAYNVALRPGERQPVAEFYMP